MTGMPFRLDIVETGEQWVVTCTTPHGKAVSRIPTPFSTDVLHRVLADIEKALIRSYSPVTTRRAAPVSLVVGLAVVAIVVIAAAGSSGGSSSYG